MTEGQRTIARVVGLNGEIKWLIVAQRTNGLVTWAEM